MGYGRTPRTVERTRPLLDEMVKSDKSIEWIFDNPQKVAYKIYEAIHFAVRSGKEDLKQYTTIANKFKLRIIPPNILKAELKDPLTLRPNGMIVREVTDVLEVIATAIEYKVEKLIFPDVDIDKLTEVDIEILASWCGKNGYKFDYKITRLELVRV